MINALHIKSHRFICGEFVVKPNSVADLLIIEDGEGKFWLQKRGELGFLRDVWFPVCIYCGGLCKENEPYECAACSLKRLAELLEIKQQ